MASFRRTSREPIAPPASAADRPRQRPALLIIDVQYRTVGTKPQPFWEAIKEFPTSCGQVGWEAVHQIAKRAGAVPRQGLAGLLSVRGAEGEFDTGRLADKVPALMTVAKTGYEFVAEIAPRAERRAAAEEASERVLRHAARQLSDRKRRRHARGDRLHHERLRARLRRRRICLQFPCRSCSTMPSTTAATSRMRSTCSTCRRNTRT